MLSSFIKNVCITALWLFVVTAAAFAQEPRPAGGNERNGAAKTVDGSVKYPVSASEKPVSILETSDILAYYGHPKSKRMGILGRLPIEELYQKLSSEADNYAAVSGGRTIKKAFYIIYGTVWPEGEIGILSESELLKWIEFAAARDMLVFLDHQIGKYEPDAAARGMFKFLKYPNVHLALDPEWRTTKPMKEIGRVTAAELNRIQKAMEEYLVANNLPGERMLVIHQFKPWMIENLARVDTSFEHVRLVHCADGFGNPAQKRDAYAWNARAANIPVKGFKLFYKSEYPEAGYDEPLLSPADVYALNPRPQVIMYQ